MITNKSLVRSESVHMDREREKTKDCRTKRNGKQKLACHLSQLIWPLKKKVCRSIDIYSQTILPRILPLSLSFTPFFTIVSGSLDEETHKKNGGWDVTYTEPQIDNWCIISRFAFCSFFCRYKRNLVAPWGIEKIRYVFKVTIFDRCVRMTIVDWGFLFLFLLLLLSIILQRECKCAWYVVRCCFIGLLRVDLKDIHFAFSCDWSI